MLKEYRRALVIQLITLLLLNLAACRGESREDLPVDLNAPLPPHLRFVAPAPESKVSIEAYEKGQHYPPVPVSDTLLAPQEGKQRVCADLLSRPLLEPGDYFESSSKRGEFLPDRVTLLIDGKKSKRDKQVTMLLARESVLEDKNGQIVARAPVNHLICWPAELEKGRHIATLEVEKTSGKTVTYSWSFTLYIEE